VSRCKFVVPKRAVEESEKMDPKTGFCKDDAKVAWQIGLEDRGSWCIYLMGGDAKSALMMTVVLD